MAVSMIQLPTGSALVGDVEQFLRQALVQFAPAQQPSAGPGRPRILPALCLWGALFVGILHQAAGQRDLWRLVSHLGLWDYPRFPVTDQAVYNRLARAGTAPLAQLFQQLTTLLAARLGPLLPQLGPELAPFASAVVALDETTLDPLARRLPALRALPPARCLPGKLAGLFDLRCQQWRTVRFVPDAQQNEKRLARELVADLPAGSLILTDLGYFSFAWFDELTARGAYWISRLRAKTSYQVRHVLYQEGETLDALIWLGRHRADRAQHGVRLIQFRAGPQLRRYITNVLDPTVLPLAAIPRLYARRWDFELAVQLVKQHLGLHLFWSAKVVVVQQQLWAVLIIAQIVQALRLEIAARAGVAVFDVSLPLLVRYLPRYAALGRDPLTAFLEAGRAAGFIRPARRVSLPVPDPDPAQYHPPPDLVPIRPARYAGRKCGPRTK